ncbi:MAG: hypothetical protein HY548_04490, partial [Elusimicrobia bacterium]|nr:hypothetical protein [Elusimicrobiota bacterium]
CQDFEWAEQRSDKGLPARWIPKENKLLYDNDQRLRDAFDVEIKGKKFRVDPELDMYRRILVDVAGSFDGVSVIDCSEGGVLGAAGFPTKRLKDALVEHCSRVIEPGESVVPHLPLIIPEIKGGN